MRYGSVCSGIEAASVAWHSLGWTPAWLAEVDVSASAVLAHRLGATAPRYPLAGTEKSLNRIQWGNQLVNWGDMTQLPEAVRTGTAEAPDILCGGTPCFTAGTFITTPGGLVPIEDIRVGESVLTHKGRYRKVLRIGSKITDETVVLTGQGHPGLRTTKEHPFYACEKKQHYTRRQNVPVRDAWIEGPTWVDAEIMAGKHWASIVDYPSHCIPQPELIGRESVTCQINEDLLWLAGAYLGDGWLRMTDRRSYIMFGVNEQKSALIEPRLERLGLTATKMHVRTGIKLQVCSGALVRWIFNNFGKGCDSKRIPPWLLGASYELRRAAMDGYIATDGSKYQDGHRITTVCWELAVGTRMLANSLGHASGILGNVPSPNGLIEGRVINQRPTWTVNISNSNRTSFEQDGLRFGLVRKVTPAPAALVYNLEVEEDNTYCADGFVVHNCQGFSVAGLRGGLSDPRGQLTLSFVELANAIDDRRAALGQQPCTIFWENVPGVRSDSQNAFGHFLAALVGVENPIEPGPRPEPGRSSAHWTWKKETSEHVAKWPSAGAVAGPRRTVAWRSSDAQFFALAQRRERVFVVASAREGFDPQVVLFEFDGLRRDTAPSREAGEDIAGTSDESAYRGSHWDDPNNPHPALTQSHNTGGVGSSNQELFSQRGAYLVPQRSAELVPTFRMVAFGEYATDGSASALKARDYKDATDLVLQPVIPILEAGARTGASTDDIRAGIGIGNAGDPMFTLQSSKQHAVAVMPFNTTQITSPENGSNPQWGDPCFSLAAGNHPPAVAISVALRGREGGGTAELGDDVAGTLRASGGGDKPHVLTVHGTQDLDVKHDLAHTLGRNHGQENAVCVTGDITHALKAEGFDGSEDGTDRGQPIIAFSCKDYGNDATLDLSPTMRAMNHSGSHANAGGQLAVQSEMAVRRLMPVECERLQGFPTVTEWDLHNMTRDEVIVAALINGDIMVNPQTGEVFGTRGSGGRLLAEPRRFNEIHPSGYRIANLSANGHKRQVRLHRVVWISQFGVPPDGMIVAHRDNIKTHNAISNLKLLTPEQNSSEAFDDGLYATGDDHPLTKFPIEVRAQIWRQYHAGGVSYRDLATKYGMSKSRVGQIVNETDYTLVPVGKGMAADGPRYKQLGNSWAVPCVTWIGKRLDKYLAELDGMIVDAVPVENDAMKIWMCAA